MDRQNINKLRYLQSTFLSHVLFTWYICTMPVCSFDMLLDAFLALDWQYYAFVEFLGTEILVDGTTCSLYGVSTTSPEWLTCVETLGFLGVAPASSVHSVIVDSTDFTFDFGEQRTAILHALLSCARTWPFSVQPCDFRKVVQVSSDETDAAIMTGTLYDAMASIVDVHAHGTAIVLKCVRLLASYSCCEGVVSIVDDVRNAAVFCSAVDGAVHIGVKLNGDAAFEAACHAEIHAYAVMAGFTWSPSSNEIPRVHADGVVRRVLPLLSLHPVKVECMRRMHLEFGADGHCKTFGSVDDAIAALREMY